MEHVRKYWYTELAQRFGESFKKHREPEFTLNGNRYVLSAGRSVQDTAELDVCIRLAHHVTRKDLIRARREVSQSLTFSTIDLEVDRSLMHARPTILDIAQRITRTTNGWLIDTLQKLNNKGESEALKRIAGLLRDEFGVVADRLRIYAFVECDRGAYGRYFLDSRAYVDVEKRVRSGQALPVNRGQQLAALITELAPIDLTESKKYLAQRSLGIAPPTTAGRLYEESLREFLHGEISLYGYNEIACYPWIYSDEAASTQIMVCFPDELRLNHGLQVPERLASLKPRALDVLKAFDLIGPVIDDIRNRISRMPEGTMLTPEAKGLLVASDQTEGARELLLNYLNDVYRGFRGVDGDWPRDRINRIATAVQHCYNEKQLAAMCALPMMGPSSGELNDFERILGLR